MLLGFYNPHAAANTHGPGTGGGTIRIYIGQNGPQLFKFVAVIGRGIVLKILGICKGAKQRKRQAKGVEFFHQCRIYIPEQKGHSTKIHKTH